MQLFLMLIATNTFALQQINTVYIINCVRSTLRQWIAGFY